MPEPCGILTIRSCGSGPGASKRWAPTKSTTPANTANSTKMLMMALPMTTRGCRALAERRGGISTVSGSIAVRGLRGTMRLGSLRFESVTVMPTSFARRSVLGGWELAAPDGPRPGSCGDGGDWRFGEDAGEDGAADASRPSRASPIDRGPCAEPPDEVAAGPLADGAAASFAGFGGMGAVKRGAWTAGSSAARPAAVGDFGAALSPPPGGALEPVTAAYPHLQTA